MQKFSILCLITFSILKRQVSHMTSIDSLREPIFIKCLQNWLQQTSIPVIFEKSHTSEPYIMKFKCMGQSTEVGQLQ